MSSEASILPLILDIAEFVAACAELKRATRKVEQLKTSDGRVHKVEAVFTDGLGREAGLQKTGKGYRVIADCQGLTPEQAKTQIRSISQVVQRYAYRKVLQQLQSQGYVVAEENKQPDDSIRLVVRKWS